MSVDGRRNLHALGRKLGLSRFEARRLLKGLMDLGLLEIDTEQPRASIPHLPGDEIIKRGGVRFARRPKGDGGDPDAAEDGDGNGEEVTATDGGADELAGLATADGESGE
ncbi:MAG: hypothetical protein QOG64_1838, partial [Acidimicrobiaceae bacterium]|nr:hypothetical protein [Acidimicrobiaceae bacterium]